MKFDFFLENISKIEKIKVNAEKAHIEFAPEFRQQYSQDYKTDKTRKAAVMAIISPKDEEAYLTLIIRTTYKGAHSGQIAFAGGKVEKEDNTLLETAYREVEEEIGVKKEFLNFCRELTSLYIPVSDFRVYPFLAYAKNPLSYVRQESEVAEIIEIPLKELFKEKAKTEVDILVEKSITIKAPAFVYDDFTIWGATSMMLNELKQVIVKSIE